VYTYGISSDLRALQSSLKIFYLQYWLGLGGPPPWISAENLKELQSNSKALIIAFEMPPEIDTCKPNLISAFVTSLLTQIEHFRYKNYFSIDQPES
jgi:hypothetical protein